MSSIGKSFTYINHDGLKIFITETPNDSNIGSFITQLNQNGIKHVVRLCGQTYDPQSIINSNINFYDWVYPDGSIPTQEIIINWNKIIQLNEPVLVHCIAGLGRAPLLAVVSLIEKKMDQIDAIDFIRNKRPGSLNSKQIEWLAAYKPKKKISLLKKIFG